MRATASSSSESTLRPVRAAASRAQAMSSGLVRANRSAASITTPDVLVMDRSLEGRGDSSLSCGGRVTPFSRTTRYWRFTSASS